MEMSQGAVRVLAADDSAVMRGIMRSLFLAHAENDASELLRMELCGLARDGVECVEAVRDLRPDVVVLDLEMPRMDGLEVLERLRRDGLRVPVIMCSSHTEHGARSTLEALARGASDYVMKPAGQRDLGAAMASLAQQLLPRIAALAKGHRAPAAAGVGGSRRSEVRANTPVEVVVIGLSTGGPAALETMLPKLPADFAVPVLIVQHMPKLFTGPLAERLDRCCALRVEQAYEGSAIRPGTVWLAPGDSHMEVVASAGRASVRLHGREPLNHCRPSVDYLFRSAAQLYGAGVVALMMTGMGSDGLDGALAVHRRGGVVLAQDEATSAVWGMPGRVVEAGIASATVPLATLADELVARVSAGGVSMPAGQAAMMSFRREAVHGLL